MHGILLSDEINGLKEGERRVKTIVMYGNKQIVGKLSLEL